MYKILAMEPLSAFYNTTATPLFRENMGLYLTYRVRQLDGAVPLLPEYISSTLDSIQEISGPVNEATRIRNE